MKITDKKSLRPLQADDANDMYDTIDAQREYLGRWLPFVAGTTLISVNQAFVDSAVDADDKTYTIRKGDKFVGLIGFKATDKANRKTEIGYWLSEEHQGQGIMTRAVEVLCKCAFEKLEINRVQIKCAVGNNPSSNIPKRLGFKFEGLERAGELFPNDDFADIEVYSRLKNEYNSSK
ncbi:GNAT family protein [Bacteroides sp.]|uniref:GNAT family N-acetyltransferase n=1 Tax=Bacteroides sp. TaxID=29523 RepID=UPI002FCB1664